MQPGSHACARAGGQGTRFHVCRQMDRCGNERGSWQPWARHSTSSQLSPRLPHGRAAAVGLSASVARADHGCRPNIAGARWQPRPPRAPRHSAIGPGRAPIP
eukprot:365126-Chlamydomonas_euryale.AAC.8